MAGTMAGAKSGITGIPKEWLDILENEGEGNDLIINMVKKCY